MRDFSNGRQSQLRLRLIIVLIVMKKINLKVLLRFLRKYSHWNLVRKSDGYQLYFLTQSVAGSKIGEGKFGRTRARKYRKMTGVSCNRIRKNKPQGKSPSKEKEVFVFNPIFNTVEEGVSVGIGLDSAAETSRRSSVCSFIWDDFLPTYNKEPDEESERKTLSGSDSSGRSTPVVVQSADWEVRTGRGEKERFCQENMMRQGDRLLKEMFQLRKDLEKEKLDIDVTLEENEKKCTLLPNYGPLEQSEENVLREKLEIMTQQIKREMEEQFDKSVSLSDTKEDDTGHSLPRQYQEQLQTDREKNDEEASLCSEINFQRKEKIDKNEESDRQIIDAPENREERDVTNVEPDLELDEEKQTICTKMKNKREISDKTTADSQILLTPDEQIAAEEILKELVDIRNNGERSRDPVPDTMIR